MGTFIDDYAADPVERNDESCIFVLETHQHRPYRLQMYPSVIEECHARLASSLWAEDIARKVQQLCADLGTVATWHATKWHAATGSLDIPFPDATQA